MDSERNIIFRIFFIIGIASVLSRRYDVEQESQKLFGHDLKNVLLEFRRTPAYKKILDKMVKQNLYEDVFTLAFMQSLVYNKQQMYERLQTTFGKLVGDDAIDEEKDENFNRNPNASIHTRAKERPHLPSNYKKIPRNYFRGHNAKSFRAEVETTTFATEEERVENLTKRLDEYVKKKLDISPEVYNKALNISYQYAGKAIQDIIEHISLDEDGHSTKSDDGTTNPSTRKLLRTSGPRRQHDNVNDIVYRPNMYFD